MKRRLPCILLFGFLLPASASAQTWSAQDKELLGHLEACWAASDVSYDNWVSVCNPSSDMVFWWAEEPAPVTSQKWWKGMHPDWLAHFTRIVWDVRPFAIRHYGDVAAVHYAWTQQLRKKSDGETMLEQGISIELYRRVGGRWQYLGGMGAPTGS